MAYILSVFPLQNAVCFIILTYLVPVLLTFYIQDVLKLQKNNSDAKSLRKSVYLVGFAHASSKNQFSTFYK